MWATVQKKPYGYLVLFGRKRDGEKHGHFEIHVPVNTLGTKHPRGFIQAIRQSEKILFSDPKARVTRTISIKIDSKGALVSFNFIEDKDK